ncbi:MAG: hypothetical protein QG657_5562, partial [Acidobacteriota bacterium]|nr:hypothetical protein [Acidobacteriota bacterium]
NVPLAEIFKTPTILGLSSFITASVKERYISIEPVEKKEYYDLSFAQRRLYILDKTETSIDTAYNLPEVMLVEGELDIQRFEDTFNKLLKRYDSFRTSFDIKNGKPVQVIHRNVAFEITYISAEDQLPISESLNQTIKNFIRPFDLSKAPLLRTAVVHLSRREHFLLFDMHHIIADGVSMGILVRNFVNLYEGNKLPALKLQYIDFAGWQNKMFKCGQMKKQEEYWLKKFNGDIPVLNMPTDYPRQLEKSFAGNIVTTEIDIPLTDKIKTVILETGNTLYIVLLTVLNILLSKYTGQDDIIVGCPTAGRNHEDLENIIGMFVNTLAMRNYLRRGMTAGDFLAEVKKNALQAFENQDYPFEELVSQLKIVQNHTRNPLFDILFVSEKLDIPKLELEDLTFTPYQFEYKISHMDLVFYIKEIEGKIELKLEYATALFKKPGVAGMLKHYLEILEQVIDNVNIKLEEIKISHEFLAPQSNILKENQDGFGF